MIFNEWLETISNLVTKKHIFGFMTAIVIIIVGFYLARRASDALGKLPRLDNQQRLVASKVSYYLLVTVVIAAALGQIGFDLRVLLGAAGILTVAIGFAAQTSASNLISGLFLMFDRPFVVGNHVVIGDIRGEVLSIDLLSCKIRTFTNLMVRVPNETMVKSNITNYSYFPIRRIDFNIAISYDSDVSVVESVVRNVATAHPLCLEDPQPVFILSGFGDSSINIQFQVWTLSANLLRLQTEIYRGIKTAFEENGIDIPFPIRHLVPPSHSSVSTQALKA